MSNHEKVVIFIAIPITDQQQMFESMQLYFARKLDPKTELAKCVAAKDLHVTIAYVGVVSNDEIRIIEQVVDEATKQYALLKKPAHLLWHGAVSLYNNAIALTFAYDEGLNLQVSMVRNML